MSTVFVIRVRCVNADMSTDSVHYLDKDGRAVRGWRDAETFETEADAWSYLAASGGAGHDESGPFCWIEARP